jgi:translation initiation factor eIF-2B subunit gamma
LESIKTRVESELKLNCGIKANLNIVGINDSNDNDDFGTANSLYLLKDKIIRDCMIVSCDLITNVSVQKMANFYRNNSASFVMLLSDNVDQYSELPATGTKGKYKFERDLIGLDMDTNRLLFFGAEAEIEEVKLKSSLINK